MPFIRSPSDGAPMRQINRYGIEFDVCPTTGGVWLDKGELEKLIALVKEETLQETGVSRSQAPCRDDDDDRNGERGREQRGGRRRSRLEDFFDF